MHDAGGSADTAPLRRLLIKRATSAGQDKWSRTGIQRTNAITYSPFSVSPGQLHIPPAPHLPSYVRILCIS